MNFPISNVLCTWQPGSSTHVRVRHHEQTIEVPFERVVRLFGRVALEAMYLRGTFSWRPAPGFVLRDL